MNNSLFDTNDNVAEAEANPVVSGEVYLSESEVPTAQEVGSDSAPVTSAEVAETGKEEAPVVKKKSKYHGVSWHKASGKWQVIVNIGKNPETGKPKLQGAGMYHDEVEAAKAYNAFVTERGLDKKLNDLSNLEENTNE